MWCGRSGELSAEEVGELLATMGTNLDPKELESLVRVMDKDGSGYTLNRTP